MDREPGEATVLLKRWSEGDQDAESALYQLLYAELRGMAARHIGVRNGTPTLQPTAVVNDAWLRLADSDHLTSRSKAQFLSLASHAMRCLLIDAARRRQALKRGGSLVALPLDLEMETMAKEATLITDLDEALEALEAEDAELGHLVELRFFGGLSFSDIATILEVSKRTAERRWKVARMWLKDWLERGPQQKSESSA